MTRLKKNYLLAAALSLLSGSAWAQAVPGNARALGMGGAYLTQAFGAEAVRWNPATLGLRATPRASLLFASFGLGVSNNAFNQADYNLYNGAKLSTADKQTLVQRVPFSGWNFHAAGEFDLLGFSYNNVAALLSCNAYSDANLPRDVVDLFLNGNALNRSYDFSSTQGSALAFASLDVAYGRTLVLPQKSLKLALGGTVKYFYGLGYTEITRARGAVTTALSGISGAAFAQARQASGGNGVGFDFGATALLRRQWRLGIAVHNLAAVITWNRNVRRYDYVVRADSLTLVAVASNENAVFSNASESRGGASFTMQLPPILHFGVSRTWENLVVSTDLVQGLRRAYHVTTQPELRCGLELNVVPALSTRGGVRFGGRHEIGSSLGVGLHTGSFHFDVAAGALGGLVPLTGKGMGLALSMRIIR